MDYLLSHSALESLFTKPFNKPPPEDPKYLEMVQDLVSPNMRCNYGGQGLEELHGFVGLVSIAGGIGSKCFSVYEGNDQVVQGIFEKAKIDHVHLQANVTAVEEVRGSAETQEDLQLEK